MASIIEKKWILKDIWNQVLRENPVDYYAIYLYGDVPKKSGILAVLFKFPSYDEMCCSNMCASDDIDIGDNVIRVVDMRLYLQWMENYHEKSNKDFYGIVFYNKMYQAQIRNRKELVNAFNLHLDRKLPEKSDIDVYQELTPKERVALREIYSTIGSEGVVSISKLIQNKNASRITYNSLLNALVTHQSAEVVSHGVKGTYVNITDPRLLKHLEETKE